MENLPTELVEQILRSCGLQARDILNFSATCSHFRDLVHGSNVIWKTFCTRRWPRCDYSGCESVDFFQEVKFAFDLVNRARILLADMSPKFYKRYELSAVDLQDWEKMLTKTPNSYHYLSDELMHIIHDRRSIDTIQTVPITTPGNLTYKYYAGIALRHIRQLELSRQWRAPHPTLESGAVIIAQWCQPNKTVDPRDISQHLDAIARQVRRQHDALTLESIAQVIYHQLGYKIVDNAALEGETAHLYIDKALTHCRGSSLLIAVIIDAVAKRLGLHTDVLANPEVVVRCYGGNATTSAVGGHSVIVREGRLVARAVEGVAPSSRVVIERMVRDIPQRSGHVARLRSVLELQRLINPNHMPCMLNLARLYMLYNMDVSELISALENRGPQARQIHTMLRDHETHHRHVRGALYPSVEAAPRSPDLKFAVGMIMRHLNLGYTCVIYDWDPVCLASPDWQLQMNVNALKLRDKQPFYNVLVEDGSHRYVAQENLMVLGPGPGAALIRSHDLGRHFTHLCGAHFVPNAEKEKEYPADTNVRHMFHHLNNNTKQY